VYVANSEPAIWVPRGGRAGRNERVPISNCSHRRELEPDGIRGGSVSYPGKPSCLDAGIVVDASTQTLNGHWVRCSTRSAEARRPGAELHSVGRGNDDAGESTQPKPVSATQAVVRRANTGGCGNSSARGGTAIAPTVAPSARACKYITGEKQAMALVCRPTKSWRECPRDQRQLSCAFGSRCCKTLSGGVSGSQILVAPPNL